MNISAISQHKLIKAYGLYPTLQNVVAWFLMLLVLALVFSVLFSLYVYYTYSISMGVDAVEGAEFRAKQLALHDAKKASELLSERRIRFENAGEVGKFGSLFR